MIVDSDPGVLHLVTELLLSDSALFEPVGVRSAEEALRMLAAEEDVDCLLTAVELPGLDGLQLLRAALELRPALKVVVMTGAPTSDLQRAVLEGGATRLLSKPLDSEDLLTSVAMDQPGALAYLEGDLDLINVCRLSAACQVEGGVRIRKGGSEGTLAHRRARPAPGSFSPCPGAPPASCTLTHSSFGSVGREARFRQLRG